MWFKIMSFLKFLLKSNNHHGIHSPFVYELVTHCFYTKTKIEYISTFNRIRQSLFNNHTLIEVQDFGRGSKIFKGNERMVSKIAKVAGIGRKRAYLLMRMAHYLHPKQILEIGTSVGLGTAALSLGNSQAQIISLEGCSNTSNIALNLFKEFRLNNIHLEIGEFKNTLPLTLKNNNIDLIYFDGNHDKTATLNYFEACLGSVTNDSVFIFDDIYWSAEMKEAWDIIKNNEKVRVSIDIFYWGLVFFRKEQRKQHFTIRV